MPDLRAAAVAVLRANDRGSYTVPSVDLYPHQWGWDSAFSAIGWAHVDPRRAATELQTLLQGAWPDGRVPHVRYHERGDYFPGPDAWGTTNTSAITQPPVWAVAARRVAELAGDVDLVTALLPAIDASHEFFRFARDPLGWDLVAVAHPWESGMDDGPQWDQALEAVDPAGAPPFTRVDVAKVDDAAQRPTDDQYRRYIALAAAIVADRHGPGPFAVYDPFVSAVLARGERDLAALAAAAGETELADRARGRAAAVERALVVRLWDARSGRFGFHDASARCSSVPDVIAAYGPLMISDRLPGPLIDALRRGIEARYATPWPLPSTAPTDPAHDPRRYWRGPSWANVNWLLAPFVGLDVIDPTLELIRREGFREYFHPMTGEGLGAHSFSWSAAVVLDWISPTST